MRWTEHLAWKRILCRDLAGKPDENSPLSGPRRRREHNVKVHVREVLWAGVDWIEVAQD
jgi:hypothetical protein